MNVVGYDDYDQTPQSKIEAAKATWNQLKTIRDQRLFLATHITFEAYCQERWGIGKDLIDTYEENFG